MVECLRETGTSLDPLRARIQEASATLIARLTPDEAALRLPAEKDLWSLDTHGDSLFLLREGTLGESGPSGTLIQYEAGDILGLERLSETPPLPLTGRFGVVVDRISRTQFLSQIAASPSLLGTFATLMSASLGFLSALAHATTRGLNPIEPNIRAFQRGEVLISQGDASTDVLTIVEGRGRVEVDGVAVGSFGPDEIVGALAFLTEKPRNATVVAEQDGLALAVTAENFSELLTQRPDTVIKLLREMALTIDRLDKRIVLTHRETE